MRHVLVRSPEPHLFHKHVFDTAEECGKTIKQGGLVAFPTETVYGLGANGLNKEALIALFEAKKRPLSDPVILHVSSADDSFKVWNVTKGEMEVIRTLQQAFWPGPCTIVARQSNVVPDEATAASGFASCRYPSHPVAQRFIAASGCPIAAPSANLFGRITPTQASHVQKYFKDTEIDLLECDECCGYGIESTVLKVSQEADDDGRVVVRVLRHGAITENAIVEKLRPLSGFARVESSTGIKPHVAVEGKATESPGQLLRHYAPTAKTCLLIHDPVPGSKLLSRDALASTILIDVLNEYSHIQCEVLQYRILSEKKNSEEISFSLFKALHDAEAEANRLMSSPQGEIQQPLILIGINKALMEGAMDDLKGVYDRLFRAATGEVVYIQ